MSEYHVADMTLEEKQEFLNLINTPISAESLGYGVSLFDETNKWLGGAVFKSPEDNEVYGGYVPEIQGSGLWIQCVPLMFPKLFEKFSIFYMESADSAVVNVLKKIGTIDVETVGNKERCWYEQGYTTAYVGDTVNKDFLSKTELPPKFMKKYTVVDENGNTETVRILSLNVEG